jgi:hypothetical protein
MALESGGQLETSRSFQEVAEPLRPRDRTQPSRIEELLATDRLDELGQDGRDVVEPPALVGVADEFERGGLRGRTAPRRSVP